MHLFPPILSNKFSGFHPIHIILPFIFRKVHKMMRPLLISTVFLFCLSIAIFGKPEDPPATNEAKPSVPEVMKPNPFGKKPFWKPDSEKHHPKGSDDNDKNKPKNKNNPPASTDPTTTTEAIAPRPKREDDTKPPGSESDEWTKIVNYVKIQTVFDGKNSTCKITYLSEGFKGVEFEKIEKLHAGLNETFYNTSATDAMGFPFINHNNQNQNAHSLYPMNIILGGAGDTVNHFKDMASDNIEFRKMVRNPNTKIYFGETSGFVRRETRFARTLYCIENLANDLYKHLNKELKKGGDAKNVTYNIEGIWMKNDPQLKEAQERVADHKKNITQIVRNNIGLLLDNTAKKQLDEARKNLTEAFLEVVKAEWNTTDTESEDLAYKGTGSSMSLNAIITVKPLLSDKPMSFHVAANDDFKFKDEPDEVVMD